MVSDYLWVAFTVLVILIVLYYILGLLVVVKETAPIAAKPPQPIAQSKKFKQESFGSASPGTFDQLGARNIQDSYQLVM